MLNQRYQKVSESEDSIDQTVEKPTKPHLPWSKQSLLVALAIGTVLAAIIAAIATHASSSTDAQTTPSPDDLDIRGCGSSPTEARALGCVYDVMMQLWTPKECYDETLTERFLAAGNWTWWADAGATHPIPDDVIRLGEHKVTYVVNDYHKSHCIFAWEKLVRALRNQGPLIEQLISYDHSVHCRHNALTEHEGVQGAVAPTGYTRCAQYDVWLKALPANEISTLD